MDSYYAGADAGVPGKAVGVAQCVIRTGLKLCYFALCNTAAATMQQESFWAAGEDARDVWRRPVEDDRCLDRRYDGGSSDSRSAKITCPPPFGTMKMPVVV